MPPSPSRLPTGNPSCVRRTYAHHVHCPYAYVLPVSPVAWSGSNPAGVRSSSRPLIRSRTTGLSAWMMVSLPFGRSPISHVPSAVRSVRVRSRSAAGNGSGRPFTPIEARTVVSAVAGAGFASHAPMPDAASANRRSRAICRCLARPRRSLVRSRLVSAVMSVLPCRIRVCVPFTASRPPIRRRPIRRRLPKARPCPPIRRRGGRRAPGSHAP